MDYLEPQNKPENIVLGNSLVSEKNNQNNSVRNVKDDTLEHVRAIILELLEKGLKKSEIGSKTGMSGQYVSMILNYKFWPKRAETRLLILKKFQNVRNDIPNNSNGGLETQK